MSRVHGGEGGTHGVMEGFHWMVQSEGQTQWCHKIPQLDRDPTGRVWKVLESGSKGKKTKRMDGDDGATHLGFIHSGGWVARRWRGERDCCGLAWQLNRVGPALNRSGYQWGRALNRDWEVAVSGSSGPNGKTTLYFCPSRLNYIYLRRYCDQFS
jgi:hypothetical protein